ncbi:MAG TPA: 2-oxo-4-hydroxy-4-carboxy-5-ureidoimidazoline decarboxylase [Candidatus Limnocylindria bacterium]|nr:2-oxo-4-hydroxy-4-carboxy-5-ureidoimidazoline decarboxylase [Candidatus Limnocylindria bacterium]
MSPAIDSIEALDAASADDFAAAVAPLFEGAPAFLGRLAAARPFGSWAALFERAREIAHEMPEPEQVELVNAHPRLGAPPAEVSKLSFGEQGYDRDFAATLAADEARERDRLVTELERLNRAYEARFGFRYCVFVAGRSRSELLPGMARALARERDSELHRALDAVVDIAIDRQRRLAEPEGPRG